MGSMDGNASNKTRIEYVGSSRGGAGPVGGVTGAARLVRDVTTISMPSELIEEG
jgi:hypothetical protein